MFKNLSIKVEHYTYQSLESNKMVLLRIKCYFVEKFDASYHLPHGEFWGATTRPALIRGLDSVQRAHGQSAADLVYPPSL